MGVMLQPHLFIQQGEREINQARHSHLVHIKVALGSLEETTQLPDHMRFKILTTVTTQLT